MLRQSLVNYGRNTVGASETVRLPSRLAPGRRSSFLRGRREDAPVAGRRSATLANQSNKSQSTLIQEAWYLSSPMLKPITTDRCWSVNFNFRPLSRKAHQIFKLYALNGPKFHTRTYAYRRVASKLKLTMATMMRPRIY